VCVSVKRDLFIREKRPIEISIPYRERSLRVRLSESNVAQTSLAQSHVIPHMCVSVKRDLFIRQKRPIEICHAPQLRCTPADADDAEKEGASDSPLATPKGFSKAPRSGWGEGEDLSDVGQSDSDEDAVAKNSAVEVGGVRRKRAQEGSAQGERGGVGAAAGGDSMVLRFDSRGHTGRPEHEELGGPGGAGSRGDTGDGGDEAFVLLMPESKTAPSKGGAGALSTADAWRVRMRCQDLMA